MDGEEESEFAQGELVASREVWVHHKELRCIERGSRHGFLGGFLGFLSSGSDLDCYRRNGVADEPSRVPPVKQLLPLRNAVLAIFLIAIGGGSAFAQGNPQVNLTTGVIGGGTIERIPDQTLSDVGTTVSLTAIADADHINP